MLQNPMVIDFIASELLRENKQDGGGVILPHPEEG